MNLVNAVVPADRLMDEAKAWAVEIAEKSPTAIGFLKQSFNADTDHQAGLSNLAMSALDLYAVSPEGMEGAKAFAEKAQAGFPPHGGSHRGGRRAWASRPGAGRRGTATAPARSRRKSSCPS